MSKSKAFLIGIAVICLFGIANAIDSGYPAERYLTATVTLVTAYFAIQTVNNGVKGKFWNKEMYHDEHGNKTEGDGK